METTKNETQTNVTQKSVIINIEKGRRSQSGEYLILTLEDGRTVIKHVNYFKALLGLKFERKAKPQDGADAQKPQVA